MYMLFVTLFVTRNWLFRDLNYHATFRCCPCSNFKSYSQVPSSRKLKSNVWHKKICCSLFQFMSTAVCYPISLLYSFTIHLTSTSLFLAFPNHNISHSISFMQIKNFYQCIESTYKYQPQNFDTTLCFLKMGSLSHPFLPFHSLLNLF